MITIKFKTLIVFALLLCQTQYKLYQTKIDYNNCPAQYNYNIQNEQFEINGKNNIINKWDKYIVYNTTKYNTLMPDDSKIPIKKLLFQKYFYCAFISPLVINKKTSNFGFRRNPFNNNFNEFHSGIDLSCEKNTRIRASSSGEVIFVGWNGGYGKLIILKHSNGLETYYGHLKTIFVKNKQHISIGMVIGRSGNTGRTTGPHLHFEIRKNGKPINPISMVALL